MFRMTRVMAAFAVSAALSMLSLPTQGAEPAGPNVTKIDSFLCKDVIRMTGEDRVIALSLLHGYYLGKKGAKEYQPSKLAQVSDDFVEYCLDHPQEQALSSFGRLAK